MSVGNKNPLPYVAFGMMITQISMQQANLASSEVVSRAPFLPANLRFNPVEMIDSLKLMRWETIAQINRSSKECGSVAERSDWSRAGTLEELEQIVSECDKVGWDGYHAEPASRESSFHARRFIELLPEGIPQPEISVDPDGEISLDWCGKKGEIVSISIGANGKLTYAGRFSADSKTSGKELLGTEIPKSILATIRRLFQ